jgi:hypothetical protein
MSEFLSRIFAGLCLLCGFAVVVSTLTAIVQTFSAIPYWDQWDGYIGFYTSIIEGDSGAWWAQHNEHRIVLSKVLFWLDIRFFEGVGIFLLSAQFLIQLLLLAVMVMLGLPKSVPMLLRFSVMGCVTALLFSWQQSVNFTWAFQSQFLLVYLFAFLSFCSLAIYKNRSSSLQLIFALLCGFFSALSMANGLLALPILFILGFALRIKWQILVVILFAAVSIWWGYFFDYIQPGGHASSFDSIKNQPVEVILFTLSYLGSPLAYAFERRWLAVPGGCFLALVTFWFLWDEIKRPLQNRLFWSFCAFLVFLAGSAFITATGRVNFGVGVAFSERYATPALMAWSTLVFMAVLKYKDNRFISSAVVYSVCFISLVLTTHQLGIVEKSVDDSIDSNFQRNVAILGAANGVYDAEYTSKIYPNNTSFRARAKKATKHQISVFSPSYHKSKIGMTIDPLSIRDVACEGHLDEIIVIENEIPAARVKGWAWDKSSNGGVSKIVLANMEGTIIGEALSGDFREDVAAAILGANEYSGWKGYILLSQISHGVQAYGEVANGYCKIENGHMEYKKIAAKRSDYLGGSESLVTTVLSTEWSDSLLPGGIALVEDFQYLSSWVGSDSFVGETRLKVESDNGLLRLCYMTGPSADGQIIEIYDDGNLLFATNIYLSKHRWSVYELNVGMSKTYSVSIKDNGTGWGEWMALGCL